MGHEMSLHEADVSAVVPGRLYLASIKCLDPRVHLAPSRISHVVSVVSPGHAKLRLPHHVRHLLVQCPDHAAANLAQHWPAVFRFVDEALAASPRNEVLIHCEQGRSRSPATLMAYLLHAGGHGKTLREVYTFVKSKRDVIHPNLGFMHQIVVFNGNTSQDRQFLASYWLRFFDSANRCKIDFDDEGAVTMALKSLENTKFNGQEAVLNLEFRLRPSQTGFILSDAKKCP